MSIHVQCNCGAKFQAKPHLAGKTVRCPKCGEPLTIPMADDDPLGFVDLSQPLEAARTVPQSQVSRANPAAMSPRHKLLIILGSVLGGLMLLCVCSGILIGQRMPTGSNPAVSTPAGSQPGERLDFDGFSFQSPMGWLKTKPDRNTTKAMLLYGGTRWSNSKAMIKVDVGTPTEPDVRDTAEAMAKNWGGAVVSESVDVDGEIGFKITGRPGGFGLQPREGIVIFRNGKVYLLMAGSVVGTSVADSLETVRATWKWE